MDCWSVLRSMKFLRLSSWRFFCRSFSHFSHQIFLLCLQWWFAENYTFSGISIKNKFQIPISNPRFWKKNQISIPNLGFRKWMRYPRFCKLILNPSRNPGKPVYFRDFRDSWICYRPLGWGDFAFSLLPFSFFRRSCQVSKNYWARQTFAKSYPLFRKFFANYASKESVGKVKGILERIQNLKN